nr:hypothetical protein [Candidatus Freyarchaeota archaeon]
MCGGFTGLNKSGKWSTYSPGRFNIPKDGKELASVLIHAMSQYKEWPERTDGSGGFENQAAPGLNIWLTCEIVPKHLLGAILKIHVKTIASLQIPDAYSRVKTVIS